jgi:hypothetical protein
MKKLENLANEKFAVSEKEMGQVRGGNVPPATITASYTESDTCQPSGGSVCDYTHSDSCIDF